MINWGSVAAWIIGLMILYMCLHLMITVILDGFNRKH